MALKTCPHCGHNVSDKATKCPECGKDPRFTDFQLVQQEQRRKKKRKTTLIVSASAFLVVLAVLCAIFIPRYMEYSRMLKSYDAAQELFDTGEYHDAIIAFEKLGNFKDSERKALDVRYQYVCTHKDRSDKTTLKYVEYLSEKNYPNIEEISDSIYKWTYDAYTTKKAYGNPTTVDFGANDPLYFMFKVYGGKPDEKIPVDYRIDYYVSNYAAKLGYSDETENGTVPYNIGDWGHYCFGWSNGIGTTRYYRVKATFYKSGTTTVLASTEAYIR